MGGNKTHQIKQFLHKFTRLKTWQFLLILLPCLFITATLMRFDHLKMVSLKEQVLAADEAGDDAAITEALQKLKDFTFSHIVINVVEKNGTSEVVFGTGPFYLEHQYQRKASEAIAQAEAASTSNPNGNVYSKATDVCKPLAIQNGWRWNSEGYINCMMSEIAKYPTSETLSDSLTANLPSTSAYRLSYASPLWAPSLSGFMIIIDLILIVVIFIRLLVWIILHIALLILQKR